MRELWESNPNSTQVKCFVTGYAVIKRRLVLCMGIMSFRIKKVAFPNADPFFSMKILCIGAEIGNLRGR